MGDDPHEVRSEGPSMWLRLVYLFFHVHVWLSGQNSNRNILLFTHIIETNVVLAFSVVHCGVVAVGACI